MGVVVHIRLQEPIILIIFDANLYIWLDYCMTLDIMKIQQEKIMEEKEQSC